MISGNIISNSHGPSMVIRGNRNVLLNNAADADVIIEGDGSTISGLVFTNPAARLILKGRNNRVYGVPERDVVQIRTEE